METPQGRLDRVIAYPGNMLEVEDTINKCITGNRYALMSSFKKPLCKKYWVHILNMRETFGFILGTWIGRKI